MILTVDRNVVDVQSFYAKGERKYYNNLSVILMGTCCYSKNIQYNNYQVMRPPSNEFEHTPHPELVVQSKFFRKKLYKNKTTCANAKFFPL